jgi:hypothetical protein
MKSLSSLGFSAAVLICGALSGNAALADDSAPAPAPAPAREPGVWQKHQYSFQYMGFTSTYSCDGLATQLKVLLLAAGARADVKSFPGACAKSFGSPDKFASANLTFYTLGPPDPGAAVPTVEGIWRSVAFASRSPREIALGDCELVEQFRTRLLPMFTARNIDDRMTCVPHQESGSVINLKFEAFAAAPATPGTAKTAAVR